MVIRKVKLVDRTDDAGSRRESPVTASARSRKGSPQSVREQSQSERLQTSFCYLVHRLVTSVGR